MNLRGYVHRIGTTLHAAIVLAAVAMLALGGLVLYVLIFDAERAERFTVGVSPRQFVRALDGDLLDSYDDVFAIAHNAGDSIATTRAALGHGVDVIEIDVVSLDGQLFAAHDSPNRWYSSFVFRGPSLAQMWRETAGATAVKLDLKESSPRYVDRVMGFVWANGAGRQVIVASREPRVLEAFARRLPDAYRLLSIGSERELEALRADPATIAMIDGVTIRATLLDEETVAWFGERGLLVMAWTVDRLGRANELVGWGVDGITTNNLAIAQLLGSDDPGDLRLDRYRGAPEGSGTGPGEGEGEEDAEEDAEAEGGEQRPGEADLGAPGEDPDLDEAVVLGGEPGHEGHEGGGQDEAEGPAAAMRSAAAGIRGMGGIWHTGPLVARRG